MAALALGLAVRAVAVLGFRPALWYPDSFQHVGVALRLHPFPVRPVGYPAMLAAVEPLGSFTWVVATQHLMGVSVAVLLYALLKRWGLPSWLACLGVLPQLLDGNQIYIEHLIQSEALFTFLIASALVTLLWSPSPGPAAAAAAAGMLAAATLVRPIGLAVLIVAGVYLIVASARWQPVAAAAIAIALPLLSYAAWFHSVHGRFALTTSADLFLYGRTAVFADCERFEPPSHLAALCEELPPEERSAADFYIWGSSPLDRLPGFDVEARLPAERFGPSRADAAGEFARLVVLNQPIDYLRTGLRDFSRTFAWSLTPLAGRTRYQFSLNPLAVPPQATYVAGGSALEDVTRYEGGSADTVVSAPFAQWMVAYQKHLRMRGPILASLLLAALTGLVLTPRTARRAPLLLWSTSILLLVVPPFVANFDHRYVLPAVPFATAAAVWGLHLLAARARLRSEHMNAAG